MLPFVSEILKCQPSIFFMCLQISSVKPWDSWNWSGDEIIHKPIIRASRLIPTKKKRYDIDIREFLTTRDNAVVAQTLGELVAGLPAQDQALFRSHAAGSFDFRADKVAQFVGTLRYKKSANKADRCPDAWLFPDETLAQKYGDCEDLAFLLAALLLASGISALLCSRRSGLSSYFASQGQDSKT